MTATLRGCHAVHVADSRFQRLPRRRPYSRMSSEREPRHPVEVAHNKTVIKNMGHFQVENGLPDCIHATQLGMTRRRFAALAGSCWLVFEHKPCLAGMHTHARNTFKSLINPYNFGHSRAWAGGTYQTSSAAIGYKESPAASNCRGRQHQHEGVTNRASVISA